MGSEDIREAGPALSSLPPRPPRGKRPIWLWLTIGVSILVLIAIAMVAFRSTSVTVSPRVHTVVFDETAHFTAYPAATAASGTLPYMLESSDIEDSEVVPTQGTQQVSDRASGNITVYNEYSADPVKLIKNTRFETPDGLIFRVPADVMVPGKRAGVAGSISVTVFADVAGEKYNVGPIAKFTLPGLKSNAAMYSGVYAKSAAAMTGGFVGERPGVAPATLEAAKTSVRARLEDKAHATISSRANDSSTVVPGLVHITYQSLPSTTEAGGGLRIHERAHVEIPVFPADMFAKTIAESVSADAAAGVRFEKGDNFAGQTSSDTALENALDFTLAGTARLIWVVDSAALAAALAGHEEAAFQGIVANFPSIQEAHARIEPFWKSSFPTDPSSIKVQIGDPKAE